MRTKNKILSIIVAVCLVVGVLPVTTFASESDCTHEHNIDCGYIEAAPCDHEHDSDCGFDEESETDCAHEHDADCGYIEAAPCGHEHDSDCGDPSLGDSGDTATPGNTATATGITVAAFDALDDYTLYQGYDFDTVTLADLDLPDTLTGTDADGETLTIEGVTWESTPEFVSAKEIAFPGYIFAPVLPEGYTVADGVTAPVITVFIRPEGGVQIQPLAATALNIGGESGVDATADKSGTGWTWTAASQTIALDNNYGGSYITIFCSSGDTVNLTYTGNVSVGTGGSNGIYSEWGNLVISGSGGTLAITGDNNNYGLQIGGTLEITSGTVTASGGRGISADKGVTVSGANVTANASATNDSFPCIYTNTGNVRVTDGSLTANVTGGTGYAIRPMIGGSHGSGLLVVEGGSVTMSNSVDSSKVLQGGLKHTGGTVNGYSAGSFPGESKTIDSDRSGSNYAGNSVNADASIVWENTYTHAGNNTLNVSSGSFSSGISFYGGYSDRAGEDAVGNSLVVSGGAFAGGAWLYGGRADDSSTYKGNAANNTITVGGFTGTVTSVFGGNGKSGATDNTVNISGGIIQYVYGGSNSSNGNATGNTVNISGGTITTIVQGGSGLGDATGNTVNISGSPTLTGAALIGGDSYFGDAFTDNTLNLHSSGLTAAAVESFENIKFYLPATTTNGATLLTLTTATDLTDVAIDMAFDAAAPTLAAGDVITLIDGVTGTFANKSVTIGSLTFDLSVSGGKLLATVPVPTYTVTVNSGTGGGSYAEGATVSITADAPAADKRFKEWTVNNGGAALDNKDNASTSFTMPANAVEVTATYEALPADTYSITVQNDGNGTANANVNSAQKDAAITLTATPNSGYQFKEWQVVSGTVTITSNSFTMPAENVAVKAIFEVVPAANYTVTFNPNGGTVSETTRTITQGAPIGTLPIPTRGGSYSFDGWYTATSGGTRISAATVPAGDITYYAHWTYTGGSTTDPGGSGNSGGSSSGGSGGGSSSSTPAPSNTPTNVSSTQAQDAAKQAAEAAKTSGDGTATANIKNPGNITLESLKEMAKAAGMPMKLQADSMSENGRGVDVRVTLNPANATTDLNLSASTQNETAKSRERAFEKFFDNNVSVVSFAQQGGFGQPVRIAAKLDLAEFDPKKLVFYSYDKATNSYKRIENTDYRIDKNGYLHFTTALAGDIIISDGPLKRK